MSESTIRTFEVDGWSIGCSGSSDNAGYCWGSKNIGGTKVRISALDDELIAEIHQTCDLDGDEKASEVRSTGVWSAALDTSAYAGAISDQTELLSRGCAVEMSVRESIAANNSIELAVDFIYRLEIGALVTSCVEVSYRYAECENLKGGR